MTKRILTVLMMLIGCVPVSGLFIATGVWVLCSISPLSSALGKGGQTSLIRAGAIAIAGFSAIMVGLMCLVTMIIMVRILLRRRETTKSTREYFRAIYMK